MKNVDTKNMKSPIENPSINFSTIAQGVIPDIWLYIRYQLLTKLITFVLFLPVVGTIGQYLVRATGRDSFSSGDFTGFFASFSGVAFLILSALIVVFFILTDIVAFAIGELSNHKSGLKYNARSLFAQTMRESRRFLHPGTLIIVLYLLIVIPLVGIGPQIRYFDWVKIPNFVSEVIYNTPLYLTIYITAIVVLSVIAFLMLATIPAMFVDNLNPVQAIRASAKFMITYWKLNLKLVVLSTLITWALAIVVFLVFTILSISLAFFGMNDEVMERFLAIALVMNAAAALGFSLFIAAPLHIRNLTRIYALVSKRSFTLSENNESPHALRKLVVFALLVFGVIGTSQIFAARHFQEFFPQQKEIDIVAHRAGGDLDAENSVEGLNKAIEHGVQWAEIDIQRASDGNYIVNHDKTFARLSGVDKSAQDLTSDAINDLRIRNHFEPSKPARQVPTLNQMLDAANGKIGLFVELKGATADKQMVDDVVKIVKDRQLEESVALISLDYEIVSYIESQYPEIQSGYLYYFSVGETEKLKGDFLIIEENLATPESVEKLQASGKKVIVWTVNEQSSMEHFSVSNVDGIITDRPRELRDVMIRKSLRNDTQIILDKIFG